MLKSGASSLQIYAISAKSCRSSLCLLFFPFACKDFCAMLSKIKRTCFFLFLLSFWEGPASSRVFFFLFFLHCVVSWLMLFGCCELWTESQKNEIGKPALQTVLHDFLGKDCMAGSVLLYFLFSLVITHAWSPRRTCIKFLLGLGAVPLEGYVHVNVSLLFVLHLLFTFTREKNNSNC
jgi:hypothetical protein